MLDLNPEPNLIAIAWDKVDLKTRLPANMKGFFEQLGLMPRRSGCRRAYQRFFIRGQAIVHWRDTYLGVYSADASRGSIRFLAPIEMAVRERARIRLPNTKEFQIEIVRCQRLDECCYDCGAIFALGH